MDTAAISMLLKLVQSGKLQPAKLVTHRFALDDIMNAYDTFGNAARERALKVILTNPVRHQDVSECAVDIETADTLTDPQIVARVKEQPGFIAEPDVISASKWSVQPARPRRGHRASQLNSVSGSCLIERRVGRCVSSSRGRGAGSS